ncbi:lysin A [Mycobacterium phage Tortellini]|uniref:Lysin A n=1 Tax=Mycobacterium phage Tortellini TaxID=1897497 RepID=A0A1D8EX27_9CAUD|nr:endolysin [Mycobacterium phage Tortellini]AOT25771.1 lysin A [Mycobacterium phage Tortellini]
MAEKLLPYDRSIVPQETGYWCGPAATQVVLNSRGIIKAESDLARQIGTTTRGTDYVGLIERVLDAIVPDARYTSVYIENDPPTSAQKETLWRNLVASINAGYGVVMNWVAPPSNKPRGVKGSVSPSYSGGTTYHYVAAMGYDDNPAARAVWIADSGFRPYGYWVSFDQAASLIPPKGYCYAAAALGAPATPSAPVPDTQLSTKDRHALTIMRKGQEMGITPRGIKIALAVALVESNITIYANPKVPESMAIPHEAVGNDGRSVGIFQQQVVWGNGAWWWGDAATCMDPASSAALFYDRLRTLDYNNTSRSPGSYAQTVQQSAYPTRYDERFAEAEQLYNRLISHVAPTDPLEELLMSNLKVPSLSIYATPGEPDVPIVDMIRALDAHGDHESYVERQALLGDTDAIARIVRTAAGKGKYGNATGPVNQAKAALKQIEAANPAALQQFLANQKGA